jgi:hypothetical protein
MCRIAGRYVATVVTLVIACAGAGIVRASGTTGTDAVEESRVKAAFLINFAKFVQWPRSPAGGSIVIGVAGDSAFGEVLDRLVHGRLVNGQPIVTRRLSYADDPAGCQVLFISAARPHEMADMLLRIRGSMLTVGETVQFLRGGGMVRMYVEDNRVRFQINQKNMEAAGLKVSSQLLMLATP